MVTQEKALYPGSGPSSLLASDVHSQICVRYACTCALSHITHPSPCRLPLHNLTVSTHLSLSLSLSLPLFLSFSGWAPARSTGCPRHCSGSAAQRTFWMRWFHPAPWPFSTVWGPPTLGTFKAACTSSKDGPGGRTKGPGQRSAARRRLRQTSSCSRPV
jgi:hypothetical protein